MNFPHLSDTQFPNLSTVDVYQFQNTFDYTRWNEKSRVKLCNVLWNSDYADVVKFESDELRDNWFDNLHDVWTVNLQTSARIVPEGYVKLPIPYDVMARYNYLFIDIPIATSENMPLDYENSDGIRRWYFFVHDIQYLSPNATQVYVLPDVWTNFQNKVNITYMMLERGHAPVANSSVEDYLANPMANNRYLLAPDINYDNASINRHVQYVPFGNGVKYVCFASVCSPSQIAGLGEVVYNDAYSPTGTITYYDIDARYGHQLGVNGYGIGNGLDYSDARTPARIAYSDGKIANNLTIYAIEAEEVYGTNSTFYQDIRNKCPQFLNTIKACFIIDEDCISLSATSWAIADHSFRRCIGHERSLGNITLHKSDFNYPQELRRFAKLYTSPYAQLEITDNDGTVFEINIEETSTLSIESVVSVAFPFIDMRVFIDGVGGTGSTSYTWRDLRNAETLKSMPNSDWFKYCFDWEIPTFALYMDGETAFMLESFNRNVKQQKQQGLVNYHTTMRSANTAYENACSQANVAYTNSEANADTARDNAIRSADTGKENADRIAATTKANTDRTALTAKDNTKRSAATDNANALRTNATQKVITDNNADLSYTLVDRTCTALSDNIDSSNTGTAYNEEMGITASDAVLTDSNNVTSIQVTYSNRLAQSTANIDCHKSNAIANTSAIGNVLGGTLQGAYSGAMAGYSGGGSVGEIIASGFIGAGVGGLGGYIDAVTIRETTGSTNLATQAICDKQVEYNGNVNQANMETSWDIQTTKDDARRAIYRENALIAVTQQNCSNKASRDNADDSRDNAKANAVSTKTNADTNANATKTAIDTNADDSYTAATTNSAAAKLTAETNATATQTASTTNANDSYTTSEACADRTKTNVQDNAGYTREVAELNAKEILENGKYSSLAAINDSRNSSPVEVCPYSGNPSADYMETRGIQIKVKTQSDSAIRQTGDFFARFGYALNQVWDVARSGLQLMNYFTYWKASEIWVNSANASNNSINTFIRNIFLSGVTVWSDPTKIGGINVYAN